MTMTMAMLDNAINDEVEDDDENRTSVDDDVCSATKTKPTKMHETQHGYLGIVKVYTCTWL